mmetsp:Transcript_14456/g.17769  ORF Transcript_14456/g.17769 Transcript_14456/m.17769 type:complete len:161 (+) Transcript_14456:40-522(+)
MSRFMVVILIILSFLLNGIHGALCNCDTYICIKGDSTEVSDANNEDYLACINENNNELYNINKNKNKGYCQYCNTCNMGDKNQCYCDTQSKCYSPIIIGGICVLVAGGIIVLCQCFFILKFYQDQGNLVFSIRAAGTCIIGLILVIFGILMIAAPQIFLF